jgi:hypothetical protein
MQSDIAADGKSPENSTLQWASLTFPVRAGNTETLCHVVVVYVWQRGTKPVTEEACWTAIRIQRASSKPIPTGGNRLRVPAPFEVERLHGSDGA